MNNDTMFQALRNMARDAGLKLKGNQYRDGMAIHDDNTLYDLIDGHGNGIVRQAGLDIDEVGAAIDDITAMDKLRKENA